MAKVTITIEDLAGGGVKVVSDPNFETMMKMNLSGTELTSAHGYALAALNHVRRVSKDNKQKQQKILVPRVRLH